MIVQIVNYRLVVFVYKNHHFRPGLTVYSFYNIVKPHVRMRISFPYIMPKKKQQEP